MNSVFSNPGRIWEGKVVFCLGSGDSLRRIEEESWKKIGKLQEKNLAIVLSINSSIKIAKKNKILPDAIYFTDNGWFEDNEELVREFGGFRFTNSRRAKENFSDLLRIDVVERLDFARSPPIRNGRSSGHRAVSLAVTLGARLIPLLGYDMQIDPESGRSHCHDDYAHTEDARAYRDQFIPSFNGWNQSALDFGCEIINCSSSTALEEFPKRDLDLVLDWILK